MNKWRSATCNHQEKQSHFNSQFKQSSLGSGSAVGNKTEKKNKNKKKQNGWVPKGLDAKFQERFHVKS